jgi:Fe-S oxidoreductase
MSYPELKALEGDIATCFRCSLCKMVPLPVFKSKEFADICPINSHYMFHSYSASGLGYMALALSEGRIPADKALADIVFSCRTCGYCDMACNFIMESKRNEINMTLRETLVREGLAPDEYKKTVQNIKNTGNPAGLTNIKAGDWAYGLDLKKLPEQKAAVLLYAGCLARYDKKAMLSARQMAKLLIHSGVEVGILGDDEKCCGLPAHWAGFKDDFKELALMNADSFKRAGIETIVTVCGACLGTIKAKYPKYGVKTGIEVLHATELLERLIISKKLKLKKPLNLKVTYHDPCYLGRQSEPIAEWKGEEKTVFGQMKYTVPPREINYGTKGVFDPPRTILKSIKGLTFNEMYRIKEYSHCCGAGGGYAQVYENMSLQAAKERIKEARHVGADFMITSCSHCKAQFEKANASMKSEAVNVLDIIDLAFQAADIDQ